MAAATGGVLILHADHGLAQNAQWNALYDRIIRLEHELKSLRGAGAVATGSAVSERRLRALEAEVNDLRRQVGVRLQRMEERLRRLENERRLGGMPPRPAPVMPGRSAAGAMARSGGYGSSLDGVEAYSPTRPEVSVEYDPPPGQRLGTVRVDRQGEPRPPSSAAPLVPPPVASVPPAGARTLPGAPAPGVGAAPLTPERVEAAPLQTPSSAGNAGAANADDLLQRARDSFLARRFGLAEASYRTFLTRFGRHDLAPEARFELGETYYVQGRYKPAAKAYLQTYKTWPRSKVAPQALLRLGMSLKRLGQKKQACRTWKTLKSKYPAAKSIQTEATREMKRARC